MLITEWFVFVHIPKTGGTFIKQLCQQHMEATWLVEPQGRPADETPPQYTHLPKLVFVRNPWDWYVSWYSYFRRSDPAALERMFGTSNLSFTEAVQKACSFLGDQFDLYTRVWQNSFRRAQRRGLEIEVGQFENLRGDFLSFLDRHGVPGDALRRDILRSPPLLTAERGPYRDYYDADLRELVREKTHRIITIYGYEF